MTNLPNLYIEKLNAFFQARVEKIIEQRDEITLEVTPENYLNVVTSLRDNTDFAFEQMIDLCGVDYLSFGDVEWDTTDISSQGFRAALRAMARVVSLGRIAPRKVI